VKPYNKIGKKYGLRKFNNFLELIEGDYTLLADISVIHGGQNTVMQACLSGNPIVGMGMHPEQEANLESCVRKGFAVRLNKWKVEASEVLEAIDKLLHDNKAKEEAKRFQKELMK